MASVFLRKQTIQTCRHFISFSATHTNQTTLHQIYNKITKNITSPQHNQQYAKYYSRFSNQFRRSGKDVGVPAASPPPFLVSGFSSTPATKSLSTVFSKIGFVRWYLGMIQSRPVITKSITSSLIYIAADLTSQTISLPSSEPYDLFRTSRMAGYGLVILGPTLHYWFNFMSKVLPGRDLLTTVKKMALGQTVYGPIMTVIFFSSNAALQGEDSEEIVARLKRDLLPTMLNGAMYWPICDFITFKFAPVQLQPLVSNGFSYMWTVYMTYMASREKASS